MENKALSQGSTTNDGEQAYGGETFLWTGAFVAREVILIAPENMTREEMNEYYHGLITFLVRRQNTILLGKTLTGGVQKAQVASARKKGNLL